MIEGEQGAPLPRRVFGIGSRLIGSRKRQALLAFAIYAGAWTLWLWVTVLAHLSRRYLDVSSSDPSIFIWSLRWWPYAVGHGLNPLHTNLIGSPGGYHLAWVTTIPGPALVGAPITLAFGPVVWFNLLVVFACPLSAWTAYLLCRRVTGSFWPSLAGGAVYGFSSFETNHLRQGHLNLLLTFLLPLIVYLVLVRYEGRIGPRVFVPLLALVLVAQFSISTELFATTTMVGVFVLLAAILLMPRSVRPQLLGTLPSIGLAYVIALAVLSPYLISALHHVPNPLPKAAFSSDLLSFVVPRPSRMGSGWLSSLSHDVPPVSANFVAVSANDAFLGIPLLLALIAFLATEWRRWTARVLGVAFVVVMAASLGPALHVGGRRVVSLPWHRLWHLPVVKAMSPSRLMAEGFLILAVAVAMWLAVPRWRIAKWAVVLLGIAVAVGNTPGFNRTEPTEVPSFFTSAAHSTYLEPSDTVLLLPNTANSGMLWQAETGISFRMVGGFVNVVFPHRSGLPPAVLGMNRRHPTPVQDRAFLAFLRRASVDAIVLDALHARPWDPNLRGLGFSPARVAGVLLYRVH